MYIRGLYLSVLIPHVWSVLLLVCMHACVCLSVLASSEACTYLSHTQHLQAQPSQVHTVQEVSSTENRTSLKV